MGDGDVLILDTNYIRECSIDKLMHLSNAYRLRTIREVELELTDGARAKLSRVRIAIEDLDGRDYAAVRKILLYSEVKETVDYQGGKGMADPLLLAYAIVRKEKLDELPQLSFFDNQEVILATKDQKMIDACDKLGIRLLKNE